MRVLVVLVLQGQRTDRRGPERDPPRPMQTVEIVNIVVVEIAVVGDKGQAGQGSLTIGLQWLYDRMVVWFGMIVWFGNSVGCWN